MTGSIERVDERPAYEEIGPKPGLIGADHRQRPGDGWWQHERGGADRWLIPGLWPWGHIPLLTGQPKAGKTTAVVDLVASLLLPGERFLGHFEPASLTEDDRDRGIVLVNAETPASALVRELNVATASDPEVRARLDVFHLEKQGGAAVFDVTDPALFDQWAHNLTWCWSCDRADDWTPSVVIVDGLTAILAAAGKGVEHYGVWYAKFRLLMTELQVPNALVVGHSTLTGNHSMGGTEALAGPDGLWTYSSDDVDNPRATRRFGVTPRMGGAVVPPIRVAKDEFGRLVVPHRTAATGRAPGSEGSDQASARSAADEEVREKLRPAWAAGLRKTEITGSGRWAYALRDALARLVDQGEVVERPEAQGFRYWLAEAVES